MATGATVENKVVRAPTLRELEQSSTKHVDSFSGTGAVFAADLSKTQPSPNSPNSGSQ